MSARFKKLARALQAETEPASVLLPVTGTGHTEKASVLHSAVCVAHDSCKMNEHNADAAAGQGLPRESRWGHRQSNVHIVS